MGSPSGLRLEACALLALFAAEPAFANDDPTRDSDDLLIIGPAVESTSSAAAVWALWTSHLALGLTPTDGTSSEDFAAGSIPGTSSVHLASTLALGLDWTAGDDFELALETRLRHRLAVGRDGSVAGDFAPEVRRALARWQVPCGPALTLGMDVVRWGRTLARPFDVASPLDWRDGPLPPDGGERVPSFGLTARQPLGQGEAFLLWTPFFFSARVPGAARVSAPTQDVWHSSELALRLTQRFGELDLGLGWMLRFDRPPALPDSMLEAASEPRRQHVLGLELALRTGPLRWAAEGALFLDQRLYLGANPPDAETHPVVRWALDVAIEPAVFFELTLGLEGSHAARASEIADAAYEGPDALWLRARTALLMAYDGVLRLDVDARIGLTQDDWWVTPALTLRASTAVNLALGMSLFGGNPLDLGLGALYDRADQIWLRATWTL